MSERKCERCESRLYPSDKRVCVACVELDAERAAFQRGSEHGQRFEREVIVAWLRFEYERLLVLSRKRGVDAHTDGQALTAELAADAIERGDHLRDDDE